MLYTIKITYPYNLAQSTKESLTNSVVHSLAQHGVDCYQISASRIAFESQRDLVFASLVINVDHSYE